MQDHDKRYEVKEMEFAELNPAQREAVEDLTDNILLLAPAGTGKTNTLAYRIWQRVGPSQRRSSA